MRHRYRIGRSCRHSVIVLAATVLIGSSAGLVGCSNESGSSGSGSSGSGSGGSGSRGSSGTAATDRGQSDSGLDDGTAGGSSGTDTTTAAAATASLEFVDSVCDKEVEVEQVSTVSAAQIDEASGLAASRKSPGVWWTHNDSGGKPELYALNESGDLLAVLAVSGAKAIDWEDLAIAVDSDGIESLYVGDIGDNGRRREHITIYRVEAPQVSPDKPSGEPARLKASPTRFDFVYPDGPRDAEALIVDPDDGDVYIIDKDWSLLGGSSMYRGMLSVSASVSEPVSQPVSEPVSQPGSEPDGGHSPATLDKVADLEFPPGTLVTAADLSPDATALAVRAYGSEFLYRREPGRSIADALRTERCTGPKVPELQGEAIAFSSDGKSYVTIPEGVNPKMHRVSATG